MIVSKMKTTIEFLIQKRVWVINFIFLLHSVVKLETILQVCSEVL